MSFFARWCPTYMLLSKPEPRPEKPASAGSANGHAGGAPHPHGHGNGSGMGGLRSREGEDEEEEREERERGQAVALHQLWALFSCLDPPSHPVQQGVPGQHPGGPPMLNAILSSAFVALTVWAPEPDIQV